MSPREHFRVVLFPLLLILPAPRSSRSTTDSSGSSFRVRSGPGSPLPLLPGVVATATRASGGTPPQRGTVPSTCDDTRHTRVGDGGSLSFRPEGVTPQDHVWGVQPPGVPVQTKGTSRQSTLTRALRGLEECGGGRGLRGKLTPVEPFRSWEQTGAWADVEVLCGSYFGSRKREGGVTPPEGSRGSGAIVTLPCRPTSVLTHNRHRSPVASVVLNSKTGPSWESLVVHPGSPVQVPQRHPVRGRVRRREPPPGSPGTHFRRRRHEWGTLDGRYTGHHDPKPVPGSVRECSPATLDVDLDESRHPRRGLPRGRSVTGSWADRVSVGEPGYVSRGGGGVPVRPRGP